MLQSLDKQIDKCPTVAWQNATIENQVLRFINLVKYHLFLTMNLSDGIYDQCLFNGLSIFLAQLQLHIYFKMLN